LCCLEAHRKCAPHDDLSSVAIFAKSDHKADANGSEPLPSQSDVHHVSGSPGSGKSHCAQAIGHAIIQQGYRVLYREAHTLLEELADATLDGKRKEFMELLTTVPLLIIDDLGMRKLPLTAAEELLEIIMRRYERASTLITSKQTSRRLGQTAGR
jgi:DNA replication protein DnaC